MIGTFVPLTAEKAEEAVPKSPAHPTHGLSSLLQRSSKQIPINTNNNGIQLLTSFDGGYIHQESWCWVG